jgi:NhaP-type Na+/H+ or K+/H+ antiporter
MIATFAWASYYVAEAFELSGIVAILFCGIMMAKYTRDNLSEDAKALTSRQFKASASRPVVATRCDAVARSWHGLSGHGSGWLALPERGAAVHLLKRSQRGVRYVYRMLTQSRSRVTFAPRLALRRPVATSLAQVIALLSETFVFVYLGMAAFAFPIWDHIGLSTVAVGLFGCFVGRLHIYLFAPLVNCFRRGPNPSMPPISATYMHVMWFSGLRGGVAFAIASVGFQNNDFPANNDSLVIMQTTLVIVRAPLCSLLSPLSFWRSWRYTSASVSVTSSARSHRRACSLCAHV